MGKWVESGGFSFNDAFRDSFNAPPDVELDTSYRVAIFEDLEAALKWLKDEEFGRIRGD